MMTLTIDEQNRPARGGANGQRLSSPPALPAWR
jgi:hypothetical protein